MKRWIGIFLTVALLSQHSRASIIHPGFNKDCPGLSRDSVDPRLSPFKAFSDSFFTAIKKKDTVFLKAHIVFPIRHSTFSYFDRSLEDVDSITASMLFKRLQKLFPADYLKEITLRKGDYEVKTRKGKTEYWVTLYHHQGGVDSNANWFFINKDGVFYFTTFYSEAG